MVAAIVGTKAVEAAHPLVVHSGSGFALRMALLLSLYLPASALSLPATAALRAAAAPRAVPLVALAVPAPLAPLAGLAVLTSVICVHEAGHFSAARAQGIRIDEFSIGFGPPLLRIPANRTGGLQAAFAVRALPIGGYVSFPRAINRSSLEARGIIEPGAQLANEVKDTPDLLQNRPLGQQAIVTAAGVVANVILAWALLTTSATTLGVPVASSEPPPVVVARLVPGSAAERAGFQPGDRLLRLNTLDVVEQPSPLEGTVGEIRGAVGARARIDAVVERAGERVRVVVPALPPGSATIGVELSAAPRRLPERVKLPPLAAAQRALGATQRDGLEVFRGLRTALAQLATPAPAAAGRGGGPGLQGPLGITQTGGNLATADVRYLLDFGAVLSLNLAVFNALPLPGLDGFQLLLLGVEGATRRRLPDAFKETASLLAGLLFVFAFARVLLSDLAGAAAAPAVGAPLAAIGGALGRAAKELGPSAALGLLFVIGVRQVRDAPRQGASAGGSRRATPSQQRQQRQRERRRRQSEQDTGSAGRWWRWDYWR